MMGAVLFSLTLVHEATAQCTLCSGSQNIQIGLGSATGLYSYAFGDATSPGDYGFSIGLKVFSDGDHSFVIGENATADANYTYNYIFGTGTTDYQLLNNVSNSIMFGINSNLSTVLVSSASGYNTWGNVGIGNITDPESLLHVRDQARLGLASNNNGSIVFNNSSNTNALTIQTGVTTPSSYTLTLPVAAPTANGQALVGSTAGVLSWADANANAWLITGNNSTNPTNNFLGTIDNVDLVFRTNNTAKMRVMAGGNVGIGTATPDGILHLLALSSTDTDLIIEKADAREGALIFDNNGTQSASIAYNSGEQMILENTISNNEIRFRVSNGTVTEVMTIDGADLSVGIGVSNPESKLHVDADDASSATETVALFTVGENTIERFVLRNNSTTNGAFAPMMGSVSRQINQPAMLIQAEVDNGNDTLDVPAMTFHVRNDATTFTTRPLFRWEEPNTVRMQMNAGGNLGIGTTSPTEILHINGRGRSTQAAWETTSDERIKENIQSIEGARTILNSLNPVTYEWVGPYLNAHPFLPTHNWGFIAQEVEQVVPDMVSTVAEENVGDSINPLVLQDLKLLNHSPLFPILVKGFQELDGQVANQQQTIDGLQTTVDSLLSIVASCCQNVGPSFRYGDLDASEIQGNRASFILFQNDPNPFQYSTEIRYSVPSSVQRAELLITDMNGRVVKRIPIGNVDGQITIYSSDLNSGIYSYSLLGDGRILESKKMICTK